MDFFHVRLRLSVNHSTNSASTISVIITPHHTKPGLVALLRQWSTVEEVRHRSTNLTLSAFGWHTTVCKMIFAPPCFFGFSILKKEAIDGHFDCAKPPGTPYRRVDASKSVAYFYRTLDFKLSRYEFMVSRVSGRCKRLLFGTLLHKEAWWNRNSLSVCKRILTHSQEVPVFQSLNRESSRFGGWSESRVYVEKAKPSELHVSYALCLLTKVLSRNERLSR